VHALFEHVGEHWDQEAIEEDFWIEWLVEKENFSDRCEVIERTDE
jgi:hypothetical protein